VTEPGINVTHTLDPPVLTLARTFAAPPELVFRAWTECERLKRWFGPKGWELTFCELDLRPGGVWSYCMSGPGGMESWGRAVYRDIVPHERIVYTDAFCDAEGNVNPGLPQTTVTILFDGSTDVTTRTEFATSDDLNTLLSMGVVKGFSETWDRLAALLEESA
jgi:uncharacterized protein YndB with AHSA1/START domain